MNKIVFVRNEFKLTKDIVDKLNAHNGFFLTKIADNINDLNQVDLNCFLLIYSMSHANDFSKELVCLKEIKNINKNTKIIVLSEYIDNKLIVEIIKNNINGCLENSFFIDNTEYVIRNVISTDGFYFSPISTKNLINYMVPVSTCSKVLLTKKQKTVALMLQEGKTYTEISNELGLSMNTIRMHIRFLYKKLNVHNRYQMIKILDKNVDVLLQDKVREMKRVMKVE